MALESGTYINSLNASNPVATDGLAQADDHLRLIKSTVKATFPNVSGAVTATHTELNYVDGVTSNIQTQLDSLIPSGTRMLFQQTAAPTGWTKVTDHNNKALRVVSGTVTTGGTRSFTGSFQSHTPAGTISNSVSGTTGSTALSISQIPSHHHFIVNNRNVANRSDSDPTTSNYLDRGAQHNPEGDEKYLLRFHSTVADRGRTSSTGSGSGHTHSAGSLAVSSTFSGTAINLDVQHVDVIIASKD